MPKISMRRTGGTAGSASGGAAAVDRALSLLDAFGADAPVLTLTELAERSGLYKSTVLRLLASLAHARLIERRADGRYSLGTQVARLHAVYVSSFSLGDVVLPALRELVAATGESASFHVRQADQRLCLYRVDSDQPLRDHIKAGDLLPLKRGAGGRVLMAFSGAKGALYSKIRREGVLVISGDRTAELAGISAPVFDASRVLVGAVTLTMPIPRLRPAQSADVLHAARRIALALGSG